MEKFGREWLPIIGNSLIIYSIGICLAWLGNRVLISMKDEVFDVYKFVNYILNNVVTNFYIPLLLVLFGKYINVSSGKYNFKVAPPITTTDEYETILENEINKPKFNAKKFIIIVDDLDRLTPNKIVEALDAIKAFVGYKNFIFIVPFDETILKDAIQREKTQFNYNEHIAIENDLFLDKLFQYRIFLPSTIQGDMSNYAIDMAKKDAKDLVRLCGGDDEFELICKEILIHKKVATPRQAKKIINTFANNLLLGYRREKDVENEVFTSNKSKRYIAKISVLQCDFSNFYTSLFVDNNLINEFLDLVKTSYVVVEDRESSENCGLVDKNINELLIPYFDKEDTKYKLNKIGESLIMFLNRTSNIEFENITRYLYLDDDRLSHLFGNEFSSSIREYLTSGVYQLVKESIQQNLDKDIGLLYEILTNSDPIDFENCCIGIINLTEIDIIFADTRLLKGVNDKLEGIFKTKDKINSKDLEILKAIEIYKTHKNFRGIDQLIINEFKEDNADIINLLNIFFKNESNVSENLKKYIKNDIIAKSSTEESGLKFNKLFKIDLKNVEMFFEPYFSEIQIFVRLSDEICEEELFDRSYEKVATFVKLFEKHSIISNSNVVLNIISKKLEYSAFIELLVEVILNNALNFTDVDVNSEVCISLMDYDDDKNYKDIIIKILAKIDWRIIYDVEDEDNNNVVDDYLVENIRNENINKILKKFIVNSQVKLIPNTILQINKIILEDIIDIEIIYEFQKEYTDEQMKDLVSIICKFFDDIEDNKISERVIKILELMTKDDNKEEYVILVAEHIYKLLIQSPNQSIKFVELMCIFKNRVSKELKLKFIKWTTDKSIANKNSDKNIKKYPIISFKILNILKDDIENVEYNILGKEIMESSNYDICDISLSLLRLFRCEFDSDEMQDEYKKFLIKHIDDVDLRENIFDDIYKHFANRDFEQDFVDEMIKYEDVLSKEKYLKGFISQFNDEENSNILQKTIDNADSKYIGNIKYLFSLYLDESYMVIIKMLINRVQEDEAVAYLLNLLELVVLEIDVEVESKIKIGSILLDVCDENDVIEVVDICKKIGEIGSKAMKQNWGEVCYTAFRNTTLDKLKISIFSLVLDNNIEHSFKNKGRVKREFSDNESALIKNYKKSNSIKSQN